MTELIITRGYPASGKTTWALAQLDIGDGNRARVNRDDLRASMFVGIRGIGTREQEDRITVAQRAMVRGLLRAGVTVIVDDTNLRHDVARMWWRIADQMNARFSVVDFSTDVESCVARDAERSESGGRGVGGDVIRSIARKFPMESWMSKPVMDSVSA